MKQLILSHKIGKVEPPKYDNSNYDKMFCSQVFTLATCESTSLPYMGQKGRVQWNRASCK